MKKVAYLVLLSLFLSGYSHGQGAVEEIVVTGIRASSDDFFEIPTVTITKKADFLVQKIRLVNDSRSPDLRKSEIVNTINMLIKAAKKQKYIEISYGEGFLEPIQLDDESLELLDERGKQDSSYINIFVKVKFEKNVSAKSQIGNLRAFIKDSTLVGRTLIEENGDIGLSIVEPQKYRYEILKAIATENQAMQKAMGAQCEVSIKGLEGRVFWERVSVGELMLYIDYSTTVTCK
jgi:hypothetical protein